MFVKLYCLFTAITVCLSTASMVAAASYIKQKHPTAKFRHASFGQRLHSLSIIFALCACPILHCLTIGVLIFKADAIFNECIERIEKNIINEN